MNICDRITENRNKKQEFSVKVQKINIRLLLQKPEYWQATFNTNIEATILFSSTNEDVKSRDDFGFEFLYRQS